MDKQGVLEQIDQLKQKYQDQEESLKIVLARPKPQQWLVNTIERRKLKIEAKIEGLKIEYGIS